MPTTYTGDQTQTQLPSDPPEGKNGIEVALPADGDLPNAATFEQAFKVLADFIDWLKRPRATASVWAKCIIAYRAAIGHRRFAVDHLGFPTGQVLVHDVTWRPASAGAAQKFGADPGSVYSAMPDWSYKSVNTTGTGSATMGRSVFGPAIALRCGDTLNDFVRLTMMPLGVLRADNHVVLEASGVVPIENSFTSYIAVCDDPANDVGAATDLIGFRITGANTWRCVTRASGVETETDSLVTASIGSSRPDRLRIEWSGETVADDATRAVRFYVNGALKATHTTNLPLGMGAGISISNLRNTAHVGGEYLIVGPMRFRMSLSEVDTVL